jgi:hypothetical protein
MFNLTVFLSLIREHVDGFIGKAVQSIDGHEVFLDCEI